MSNLTRDPTHCLDCGLKLVGAGVCPRAAHNVPHWELSRWCKRDRFAMLVEAERGAALVVNARPELFDLCAKATLEREACLVIADAAEELGLATPFVTALRDWAELPVNIRRDADDRATRPSPLLVHALERGQ
jgi:hypothetical protein